MQAKSRDGKKARAAWLARVRDDADLPAIVPRLPGVALASLVQSLGLADAVPVLEAATPHQLGELLDQNVWRSPQPGKSERLNQRSLAEWIEVLLETESLSEKLDQLGRDFLATILAPVLVVERFRERIWDFVTMEEDADIEDWDANGSRELYGDFLVEIHSRSEHLPEKLVQLLSRLWAEAPDLLEETFAELARADPWEIARYESFNNLGSHRAEKARDLREAREERRREQGFVGPLAAREFLLATRSTELLTLMDAPGALYVSHLNIHAARPAGEEDAPVSDQAARPPEDERRVEHKVSEILTRLGHARNEKMLPAHESTKLPIEDVLAGLALEGHPASGRALAELSFLANVLKSGASFRGGTLSEHDAARAAMSTANLGLLMRRNSKGVEPVQAFFDGHGVLHLFQLGWHHLHHEVAMVTAAAIDDALRSGLLCSIERENPTVGDALRRVSFVQLVVRGETLKLRDRLQLLAVVVPRETAVCLEALLDAIPHFPELLEDPKAGFEAHRFFARTEELGLARRFLENPERNLQ